MKTLIIGSGIAGLSAAIISYEQGHEVCLVTKSSAPPHSDEPIESNSAYAQGGVVYEGVGDPELLGKDILNATANMAKESAVWEFVSQNQKVIKDLLLDKIQIPFEKKSKKEKESFLLTKEASHSNNRILFANDTTGKTIMIGLLNYIKCHTKIEILTEHFVLDLITLPHHSKKLLSVYDDVCCIGAYVFDLIKKKVKQILADKIIIATGGIGAIYEQTTNPSGATGDGVAIAQRANIRIINMEYTQFHPTTFFIKGKENFLISEAARGEGAVLVNKHKKQFMEGVHDLSSLAPRDIVAREIMYQQYHHGEDAVYLDMTKIKGIDLAKRFPNITKVCSKYKIDLTKELIPVTPAFHFSCGGIWTNLDGKTNFDNVFAIGECACSGIHGANRLASTSLAEGIVFGYKSALAKVERNEVDISNIKDWEIGDEVVDKVVIRQYQKTVASLMWNHVGILRKKENLSRTIFELQNIKNKIDNIYRKSILDKELLELRNSVQVALLVVDASLKNQNSVGCHFIEK